jgi:hypothetical protein
MKIQLKLPIHLVNIFRKVVYFMNVVYLDLQAKLQRFIQASNVQ